MKMRQDSVGLGRRYSLQAISGTAHGVYIVSKKEKESKETAGEGESVEKSK